jgi:hypothetical protein
MARYSSTIESAAGLAAGPTTFANIVAAAGAGFRLRRVIIGVRSTAPAITPQNQSILIARATARGTATTTLTPVVLDFNTRASQITGVDTAWSGNPTVTAAPGIAEISFNTQTGADIPFELLDNVTCTVGTANGIAFQNVGNVLPASHLYTLTVVWEE